MDSTLLGEIAENDYPAFVRLPGSDFPKTYNEWLNLTRDQATHFREAGNVVVFVRVQSDEFSRHCRAKGAANNLNEFYRFLAEKRAHDQ